MLLRLFKTSRCQFIKETSSSTTEWNTESSASFPKVKGPWFATKTAGISLAFIFFSLIYFSYHLRISSLFFSKVILSYFYFKYFFRLFIYMNLILSCLILKLTCHSSNIIGFLEVFNLLCIYFSIFYEMHKKKIDKSQSFFTKIICFN